MNRMRRFIFALAAGLFVFAAAVRAADDAQVIYPAGTPSSSGAAAPAPKPAEGFGFVTVLGVLVLAGAGGWMLWRGRKVNLGGKDQRLLAIDETRPLGNRQYLVVASYEGKKVLLGVCPGRIDLLASLTGDVTKDVSR
jgi:flagellar protein FliO/FliZ